MLSFFRSLSFIEGLSLVALLVAMVAKYQLGYVNSIWQVGMTHGILWLAYFVVSLIVSHQQRWSVVFWVTTLIASVIPFAFIVLDGKLKNSAEPAAV